jgi:hypothetical protein
MAQTPIGPNVEKVGIVYGVKSGHVRRHIYAELDHSEYYLPNTLLPGEAMCFVDVAHHHAGHEVFHAEIRKAVKAHGNVDAVLFHDEPGAMAYRWVHVDPVTNVVTSCTMADPAIDNVKHGPNHQTLDEMGYVNVAADHPPVSPGHIFDPKTRTFKSPFPEVHPSKLVST